MRATSDLVTRHLIVGCQQREHFNRAATTLRVVKQRKNERLLNRDGAIDRATIAPALEAVRNWNIPMARRRLAGFVRVEREMHNILRLQHLRRKLKISRRVVEWIATEHDERVDCA